MSIAAKMKEVPHPGEFIRDELEARNWAQRDLAYILGVKEQAINPIMSGRRGISPEMAQALSKAFGISAEYFLNLQKAYELSIAREADPAIERRAKLQAAFPIREMIKRNWFEDTKDVSLFEEQVKRFFQTEELDQVPCLAHSAKKFGDYKETTSLQWAWLFRVRQLANEMIVPSYSEKKLNYALAELEGFLVDPENVRLVPRVLAEAGIRFVIVETLPNANIDGACFWLNQKLPVIGMTCRHDRIDNFWFVLRHEIEHVLRKDSQSEPLSHRVVDIDLDPEAQDLPEEEQRANAAASQFLADQQELESFLTRKYPYMAERDTVGLALRLKRHPGIVVGQLQFKMAKQYQVNKYNWLAKHKVKIRHFLKGSVTMDGWGDPVPTNL